jgi:hypothetical protein
MIQSRWRAAVILAAACVATAHAAPPIAGGDLPGRERERFVEPPVGRAFQQAPLPEWHAPANMWCRRRALRHSHRVVRRACRPLQ